MVLLLSTSLLLSLREERVISLVRVGVPSVSFDPSMSTSFEGGSLEELRASLNDDLAAGAGAAVPLLATAGSVGELLESTEASMI
jgi:hypothetical protein